MPYRRGTSSRWDWPKMPDGATAYQLRVVVAAEPVPDCLLIAPGGLFGLVGAHAARSVRGSLDDAAPFVVGAMGTPSLPTPSQAPAFIDLVGSLRTSRLSTRILRRFCRHRLLAPACPGLVAAVLGPLCPFLTRLWDPASLLGPGRIGPCCRAFKCSDGTGSSVHVEDRLISRQT